MKQLLSAALIVSAISSQTAFAQAPSFNYVDAGYAIVQGEDDLDGNGFSVKASYALSDNWYLLASYIDINFDDEVFEESYDDGEYYYDFSSKTDLDTSMINLGVGYRWATTENSAIAVDLSYVKLKAKVKGRISYSEGFRDAENPYSFDDSYSDSDSDSANGAKVKVGYYSNFAENFQSAIGLSYIKVKVDDETLDDTGIFADISYKFTDNFAVSVAAEIADEKSYILGARYYF